MSLRRFTQTQCYDATETISAMWLGLSNATQRQLCRKYHELTLFMAKAYEKAQPFREEDAGDPIQEPETKEGD